MFPQGRITPEHEILQIRVIQQPAHDVSIGQQVVLRNEQRGWEACHEDSWCQQLQLCLSNNNNGDNDHNCNNVYIKKFSQHCYRGSRFDFSLS